MALPALTPSKRAEVLERAKAVRKERGDHNAEYHRVEHPHHPPPEAHRSRPKSLPRATGQVSASGHQVSDDVAGGVDSGAPALDEGCDGDAGPSSAVPVLAPTPASPLRRGAAVPLVATLRIIVCR